MNALTRLFGVALLGLLLVACDVTKSSHGHGEAGQGAEAADVVKGPNGGRLLSSGDFALELAIFERGVAPELRAWATKHGRPVAPGDVALEVELTRLGGRVDRIAFKPQGDLLQGDGSVHEPHSFVVSIEAVHEGERHAWTYDNFDGRTRIEAAVADALGVGTEVAGPAVLTDAVTLYGRIRSEPGRVREIRARFDGVILAVLAEVGSRVAKGDTLLKLESNESLEAYAIQAPIAGVVTQRDANPGEQTSGRLLLTLTDTSSVQADLSVFPADRARIRVGSAVVVSPSAGGASFPGVISTIEVLASVDQSIIARVVLQNPEGRLVPGTFVTAQVTVAEHAVPIAVKRTALQSFRDFTVVYAQVGEEYEVRMLDLGRETSEYVEVLGGLEPGERYVSENSYLIKADIEKSGASHDH